MKSTIYRLMIVGSGVAACAAGAARADDFPTKPIRMIVPFSAGGPTDAMARDLAQRMSNDLGQTIIVDNRPGAGGNIGAEVAAKSAPDGYTMLFATNGPLAGNPSLYRNIGYDPIKSFTGVTNYVFIGNILAVNPNLPVRSFAELMKLLKANPGKYSYASGGSGTTQHFSGELLKVMGDVKMIHVPYKGEAPATVDVLGNQVPIIFCNPLTCLPYIRSGKLIALAVTSPKRNPALPNVPAIAETLPGYDLRAWYGLAVPANTPVPVVKRLNAAAVKAVESPEVIDKIHSYGGEPQPGTPEEFTQFIRSEVKKWESMVKTTGARLD